VACKGTDRLPCVIQKFGGACFADTERLCAVARQLLACGPQPVVAVVSAPQGVTDHLTRQMRAVGGTPASPAMDVLLATGELQSAALVAAALGDLGRRTEVLPPWAVFRTDAVWGKATMEAVHVHAIREALRCGVLPIVPGFIGATAQGCLTTLGRGGSDYSAVALGVALGAARVELYKAEVVGGYNADPQTVPDAQRFERLTHAEALRLACAGGKVLQAKAAALASCWSMPVYVRPAFAAGPGTAIGLEHPRPGVATRNMPTTFSLLARPDTFDVSMTYGTPQGERIMPAQFIPTVCPSNDSASNQWC
jgi:aspartate kinase